MRGGGLFGGLLGGVAKNASSFKPSTWTRPTNKELNSGTRKLSSGRGASYRRLGSVGKSGVGRQLGDDAVGDSEAAAGAMAADSAIAM